MTLLEVKEWSQLDHASAPSLRWLGENTEREIGGLRIRATASGAVMVGDVALTPEQARAAYDAIVNATCAQRIWLDHQSGRTRYITHQENGKWFCTHMGLTGELRRYRPRKAATRRHTNRCYVCSELKNELWIPVHKPWNGSNEVSACICEPCLKKCEGVRRGIRLVGKEPT